MLGAGIGRQRISKESVRSKERAHLGREPSPCKRRDEHVLPPKESSSQHDSLRAKDRSDRPAKRRAEELPPRKAKHPEEGEEGGERLSVGDGVEGLR